jgi:acetoacetyl-CoA synthetase
MTYAELNERVASLAQSLRETGLVRGDTVAAYMPNQIETIIAMLASTSIGAIWSTCGAELGTSAVIDRIGQIRPKVLFAVDKYLYKGKNYNILDNLSRIVDALPTLERVIIVENGENDPLSHLNNSKKAVLFDEFTSPRTSNIVFEQLPFDYPVYVMFSSGTTGKPKSIVQGAGGVLLNHLKELIIHCDVKRSDKITYLTSPSWMMWNWLVSALGTGSTIFLYNGDPNYPTWEAMWNYIQSEKVTIFGCSASYINNLKVSGARPSGFFDLSMLREISQTGSPLSSDGFELVYLNVKKDIHFNSMSGGTDLNGCFAVGNPSLPVYAGEVQAAGLGMKIAAYDEKGEPVLDKESELVCEAPSPSMPLYFWNDPNNVKYLDSYFSF